MMKLYCCASPISFAKSSCVSTAPVGFPGEHTYTSGTLSQISSGTAVKSMRKPLASGVLRKYGRALRVRAPADDGLGDGKQRLARAGDGQYMPLKIERYFIKVEAPRSPASDGLAQLRRALGHRVMRQPGEIGFQGFQN